MAKNKSPKRGRPPKDLAGNVQARILDAAQQLFLEKAFEAPASTTSPSWRLPANRPSMPTSPARRRCSWLWWPGP